MNKPVMDYQSFLWRLLLALTDVRLSGDPHGVWVNESAYGLAHDLIQRGVTEGYVSDPEFYRLHRLLRNAALYSGDVCFPDVRNAGPYMPTSVWFKRHKAEAGAIVVKLGAQGSADEESEPVPAPTSRRQVRLLCVLVNTKLGAARGRYLPVHTMHRLPPRAMVAGKWSDARYAGLHLRETRSVEPTAQVLARCVRQRQANPFRTPARTI